MTHTTFARRRRKVAVLQRNLQQLHPVTTIAYYLFDRLQESSTWRGIFMLLTALGIYLSPEQMAAITTAGLSIVGLINVFRHEKRVEK